MSNLTEQIEVNNSDFVVGDFAVLVGEGTAGILLEIIDHKYSANTYRAKILSSGLRGPIFKNHIRRATPAEIAAGRRLDVSEMERTTSDMGDDTHIENHISPLCKTESQPVLIVESDNQLIERLKAENVVLQAKVDELQAENKILNQAASTRLRNQNHYMDLYHRLIEQLYPYAIDLEDPVDGDVNTPPEFINGHNLARECAHYALLEMMESDVEYIKAQCGMLGGGGEA